MVDPDPIKVAEAVEYFKNNPMDAEKIRGEHINLSLEQRNSFVNHLQKKFNEHGISLSAREYFDKSYFHKLRGGAKLDKVIRYWN